MKRILIAGIQKEYFDENQIFNKDKFLLFYVTTYTKTISLLNSVQVDLLIIGGYLENFLDDNDVHSDQVITKLRDLLTSIPIIIYSDNLDMCNAGIKAGANKSILRPIAADKITDYKREETLRVVTEVLKKST